MAIYLFEFIKIATFVFQKDLVLLNNTILYIRMVYF